MYNDFFENNEYDERKHIEMDLDQRPRQVMAGSRVVRKNKKAFGFKQAVSLVVVGAMVGGAGFGAGVSLGKNLGLSESQTASELAAAEIVQTTPQYVKTAYGLSDSDVVGVIKNVHDSVVSINLTTVATNIFYGSYEASGAGSGVIFYEDNENVYIVTNYHVISDANQVSVSIDDTNQVSASYVGSDPQSDIAVISVEKGDMIGAGITNYAIANFGDSDAMEMGETVIALGNAYGEGKSATLGIISAKDKQITASGDVTLDVIQTDAAINPGNSGGALVNLNSQVIGLNTAKLSAADAEGMGYAIPSNTVSEIITEIMEKGTVERPYIGITGETVTEEMMNVYSLPSQGVYVRQVSSLDGRTPLSDLRKGDIIVAYNGETITTMEDLQEKIGEASVGDTITLSVYRGDELVTVDVTVRNYNKDANF